MSDQPSHPALAPGRTAVITGAASGIGLAAARRFAALGMRVCLADIDEAALQAAAASLAGAETMAIRTDVSRREDLDRLKTAVYDRFGEVAILMNNAGREGEGALSAGPDSWHKIIDTNLWGVINGVQAFTEAMTTQGTPCAIINTGSKQGITCPPGNTAYNVSKAGIKVVTEALAHDLRNTANCAVTAHLLIPGFVFTAMTRRGRDTRPDAAWTPEQTVDFMLARMAAGDFYILCPDNDVSRETDNKRIAWAAQDITENRPPLSRWHPDWANAFKDYMAR